MLTFKELYKQMLQYKRTLFIGNSVAILATILSIPIPLLIPLLVDEVLLDKKGILVKSINFFHTDNAPYVYIASVLVATITLRFIYLFASVVAQKYFIHMAQDISYNIRSKVLEHLKNVSMNVYEKLGSGTVVTNLITDVAVVEQYLSSFLSKLVVSVSTLIGVAIVLIVINPFFAVLILIFHPLIVLITKKISSKIGILKKDQNQSIGVFSDYLTQMFDLFGQIRASNKEDLFINKGLEHANTVRKTSQQFGIKSLIAERYSYTLFLSSFEVFRATGLLMVLYSDLSIGLMFAIFGYLWFMMTPVQELLNMQYAYANAKGALDRINTLLAMPKETEVHSSVELFKNNKSLDIELKNVSFGYNNKNTILSHLNMKIKAQSTVAFIGASGSGKTTLSQLLVGFYAVNDGDILYNKISIKEIGLKTVRKYVFVVLQQPLMFNDTLAFNLTMGEEIAEEELYKALEIAQLSDFIKNLKDGLDTQVGKFGVKLSGGQRQRLSIARMVLSNPKVVIFDESTSALDVHTEATLFKALKVFLEDKTVIIIAHRLSTINNADYIYMLEDGKITEEGTDRDLQKKDGSFSTFIQENSL